MANYYVSNFASNGYPLGVDSNNGTSQSTPFLTINKAVTTASNGDTITVNPTSSTTASANNAYIENSGSGYLSVTKGLTIQADPSVISGYVVIQAATANGRVVSSGNTSANNQVWKSIVLDQQSAASQNAFTPNSQTGGLNFTNCTLVNQPATGTFLSTVNSTGSSITFTDCYLDPTTLGTWANIQMGSISLAGGTYVFNTANQKILSLGTSGGTIASVTITADAAGNNCLFSGNGIPMQLVGALTNFNASGFTMTNTARGFFFTITDSSTQITGQFNLSNFTVTYGSNSTQSLLSAMNELFVSPTITNATITQPVTNSSIACINTSVTSGSPSVTHSKLNNAGTGYGLIMGTDGFIPNVFNNTATTLQNLGDISTNNFVDEFMTTQAITGSAPSYAGSIVYSLKKVGSPTGTLSCSVYTDNAGVPGTLIETTNTVLAGTNLTTSALPYQFNYSNRTYIAPGTKIHHVLSYSGTNNATDYVQISANATTTTGSILTSANGTAWVANTSNALLFSYNTGSYSIVDPVAAYNTVTNTGNTTTQQHAIIFSCTVRGKQYSNQYYNTAICNIMKLTKASSGNRALVYDNLAYTNNVEPVSPYLMIAKSCQYTDFFNNTVICGALCPAQVVMVFDNTLYFPAVTGTICSNALMNDNVRIMNNIIASASTNAGQSLYVLSNNLIGNTNTNITIDYNDVYITGSAPVGQYNGTTYSSFASWQGQGFDTHSITTNPVLANLASAASANDFIPSATSPVIAVGINTNGSVPKDFLGNNFAVIPDMGAYSVTSYYLSTQSSKIVLNPFIGNFDYEGLTVAVSNQLYAAIPTIASTSTSLAVPSTSGRTVIFCNATSGNIVVTLPTAVGQKGTIVIVKTDSSGNSVSFAQVLGQTYSGVSSTTTQNAAIEAASDNANYHTIT